ncbi:MAG: isocitrate/isopropylmalate dehydrogenase family protein [Cenarchaeum sp. SB0665_bin_23]|nr:isocitrate/isopropylmalate dehydrogenase family protein [Cenarchaeum sp. SB0667_bin_13]MXY37907.1 isocitrate/isopropylmalate dehydrogenase family protein [Cenarchaeum sp. SB0664_bin_35]MXY61023.1 isocitrate/isopropylmalate dehydrogenase family protein [Cenarchaeum sp. SB0665_bin_23]MYB47080.1 isocitrate/isopropylmalate dehydrogenase family protein [Cenarchaeum sp. SB0662_bin_33]MYC78895.1 isocitrate/isopropylmalate dehydrogenase family protein [Cenarchaeum sp. SB0661_bin_35]MYG32961.1 isoci
MYKISLITGDGVGPELADSAITILNTISEYTDTGFAVDVLAAGDKVLHDTGEALPTDTIRSIKESDACLKAPVGESAADVIVRLRRMLDLYANIRPARAYPGVPALRDDVDMVIVRENTEDLYIGEEFLIDDAALALRVISRYASCRIAHKAFEMARQRNMMKKVTCVHKSNVMRKSDGLFSEIAGEVAIKYPDVILEQMYVDACAMNLIRQPEQFDVILTTNMFGDILSDESSQVVGGLGVAPAANIGDDFALFEPVHGAAFDIAGRDMVNPISFILSIHMMLEWLGITKTDDACISMAGILQTAVSDTMKKGIGTVDIGGTYGTRRLTDHIACTFKDYYDTTDGSDMQ